MNIKILSDSTCDLPRHLLEEYDITITPLSIVKNNEVFKDGITITPADIFAHVAEGGALCSTSAVSVGEYQDFYEQYAKDYDGVIQITLGSGFSASYQNACLAAEDYDNVRVVDSQNIHLGQGVIALKAAQLAKDCDDLDALADVLREYVTRVEARFVVDKLDYLAKGGRCSSATALGANLLNLKPCIEVKDNKMTVVKKYRGNLTKCLVSFVKDHLEGREDLDPEFVFVAKTTLPEDCYQAVLETVKACGTFHSLEESIAGCTISCHCGPGTMGLTVVRKAGK